MGKVVYGARVELWDADYARGIVISGPDALGNVLVRWDAPMDGDWYSCEVVEDDQIVD